MSIHIGEKAPSFQLPTSRGTVLGSADASGAALVLIFLRHLN